MRWMLFLMLVALAGIAAVNADDATDGAQAKANDRLAQNFTEHSWIFVNGYMEESRILQTQTGFKGQKIALTTSGSGMATRTIDSEVFTNVPVTIEGHKAMMDEASLTISANYDYRPYIPPLTQSDLRNALCAKNYEVGSVFSETYNIDKDLIKDTNIYQNDSFSVYQISSEIQGTARIGQRVQKNAKTVPSFMMNGMYVGYAQIRSETIVGNTSVLTLPCP
jgi:hypothetical protein